MSNTTPHTKPTMASFTPSINSIRRGDKPLTPALTDTLSALREDVEVLRVSEATGNSKVRDSKGRVFYCNSKDLFYHPSENAPEDP